MALNKSFYLLTYLLTYALDLKSLKMYLYTRSELFMSMFSKVRALQRDRQTDTCDRTQYHAAFTDGNKIRHSTVNIVWIPAVYFCYPKFREIKISASMLLVRCICLSRCLSVRMSVSALPLTIQQQSSHQTLQTGKHISVEGIKVSRSKVKAKQRRPWKYC